MTNLAEQIFYSLSKSSKRIDLKISRLTFTAMCYHAQLSYVVAGIWILGRTLGSSPTAVTSRDQIPAGDVPMRSQNSETAAHVHNNKPHNLNDTTGVKFT